MSRSGRLTRFLEFTVTEMLAGNASQIKEFVVGIEVFNRGRDYDPRLDPIVRVEARRLRMKLRRYYETEGRTDRLRIEFPKGSYVPIITHYQPAESSRDPRHAIAVIPFRNAAQTEECERIAGGFDEELIGALTKLDCLRVVPCDASNKRTGAPRDYERVGRDLGVDFLLEGSIRSAPSGGELKISAQLVNVRDASYLWAESWVLPHAQTGAAREAIAEAVTRAFQPLK